jgi:hypothetical protein
VALIEPEDVRRLFEGLVRQLAERDPGRLQAPFQVAELYQQIVPYKTHRSQLHFDTNQDYEAAVLGLLAGVGGYATLEPVEAQESLAAEAEAPNPDTGLFREFAGARVRLQAGKVKSVLDRSGAAYAPPPAPEPEPEPETEANRPPVFLLDRESPLPEPAPSPASFADLIRCRSCNKSLPGHRPVVFCPWCGRPVGAASCGRCGDELEEDWRFCPRCGLERRS